MSESGRDYYGWMTNDGRRVERVGGGGHGAIAREQLGYGHLDAEHAGDQALRDGHVRYLRNNSSMVVELHHSRPDAAERAASMIRSHAGDRFVVDLFDHPEGQAVDSHGKTWLNTTRKHEALDFLQRAATRRAPATDIARARQFPYGEGVADAFIRQQLLEAAPDLQLTAARQAGRHFETGRPVEFRYVRNTERAPHMGSRFGQDIEPHGRYMVHNEDPGDVPRGWETGTHRFENPIVMRWGTTTGEPHGWKHRLSSAFGGKKGKALSAALRRRGHDGIVTVDEFQGQPDVREIVALGDHR